MANYDSDRDGALSWQEFLTMYRQNRNKFPIDWKNDHFLTNDSSVHDLFKKFDLNRNNRIGYSELRHLLQAVGSEHDDNTIARLVLLIFFKYYNH
jgi:Ca2+-binding EF-hand superfamily protein